jgi:4-amino-4-deoxy-L-arabinose transferase-like glycosyltransferase
VTRRFDRRRLEVVVVVVVLAVIVAVFLRVSPDNPPGFFRDESAIAYNAYSLATTGRDEYGARTPLFIRSFGDYKSPLYVYLLAGVYRVTGLSIGVARGFSAVLGLAAVLVVYWLAFTISRRQWIALAVAMLAGLTPWLFESTRVVYEVALMPLVVALLLLAVYRASAGRWRWGHSVAIGLLLGALAYTYQSGRVLAPLLAVGLLLCWHRGPWRQLGLVWAVFLASVVPIALWSRAHPGALTARYHNTTYLQPGTSFWDAAGQFFVHYAHDMNVWHWLRQGDPNELQHVQGTGSVFFVEIALALAGIAIVLVRRRSSPWWWFVLFGVLGSPVAAALTSGTFPSLRMISLAVYVPLLAIPALEEIASLRGAARPAVVGALLVAFAVEAAHWQLFYERHGPDRTVAFEAMARPLVDSALRSGRNVYVFRSAHGPYIDTLLYGAIAKRPAGSILVLDPRSRPPAGALVVGAAGECPQCPTVDRAATFESFRYRPARPGVLRTSFQLNSPLLGVDTEYSFLVALDNTGPNPADHVSLIVDLPRGIQLLGAPYHDRGTGCTGRTTIVCAVGWLPGDTQTVIRYEAVIGAYGPQTMTAAATSDDLDVNPIGTASAFTVDLSEPAYARDSPPSRRLLCGGPIVVCPL